MCLLSAGTIAAIQSGRAGAKTLLLERNSQLGGTTTTGGVSFTVQFGKHQLDVVDGDIQDRPSSGCSASLRPTRAGVPSASPLPPGRRRFRSPEALAGHNDVDFRIPPSHAARRDLIQQAVVVVVLGTPYGEADVSEKVGIGDFVVRRHGKLFQIFRLAQTPMKQIVDFRISIFDFKTGIRQSKIP